MTSEDERAAHPVLRIVRGTPTEVELAALLTVLADRSAAAAAIRRTPVRRACWSERRRLVRGTLHPGPGAWRASALPH